MLSYHTRRTLRGIGTAVLVLALVAAGVLIVWLLWLNRYVIYTRSGAKLDFSLSAEFPAGELPVPPTAGAPVDIFYNEGENVVTPVDTSLKQLSGIYVTGEMLAQDFAGVREKLLALEEETPILLDVKNIRGEFYYMTNEGKNSEKISPRDMNDLIAALKRDGHYLIAKMPAFRDYWYGLEHVNDGIFNPNRLSLWMDADHCYWLNPAAEGTLSYLTRIVSELRVLGFDEVVFSDFCIPDTDAIYFEGDRTETVNKAASDLVRICSTDTFAVSFVSSRSEYQLPEGRSRLYFENVAAAEAAGQVQLFGVTPPEIRAVFLTDLMDTRFDAYGVLRPLETGE